MIFTMQNKEWEVVSKSNEIYQEQEEKRKKLVKKLFDAVSKNNKDVILKLKGQVSFSSIKDNNTCLSICTLMNNEEMIDFLLGHGAVANTIFNGQDVAWLATSLGNVKLFKKFLPLCLLNFKVEDETRLIQAVEQSNPEIVKTLLNYGINIHEKDDDGRTALHHNFNKIPYTDNDKIIGAMLLEVGLSPLDEDLSEIPAYGYLENIEDIKDYYDIETLPDLPSYKEKRIEKIREKELEKDGIIAKYKDIASVSKTPLVKPKSFKSYYLPKVNKPKFGK